MEYLPPCLDLVREAV